MVKFAICIFMVLMALLIGCFMSQMDKQQFRDEIRKKKEKEIEKINAADLVSNSNDAKSHRQRKSKICDEFRANTDAILADVLRSASKNAGSSDSGRGRN